MWKDSEADLDFLNFNYLAEQVVEISKDDNLSPATIGIYGDWGSGKSSLMKMVKKSLDTDEKTLTVEFNGWLFEGYEDAKTALCGTILDEMHKHEKRFAKAKNKIKALLDKVDGGKLLSKGVKYGLDFLLTGGIGTVTELTLTGLISAVKQKVGDVSEDEIKKVVDALKADDTKRSEIKNFRKTFKEVFEECKGERLVVFIDELDRCIPDTVLDIFEAIRLFLYVPGTTFIIGADERLVSYAVKTKYKDIPGHDIDISKEYLEKLVQYPVKIPQLNESEVKQYITCLLLQNEDLDMKNVAEALPKLSINEEFTIDTVKSATGKEPTESVKETFDLSNQIYSALATLMKGNPRHCKRFFNTLMMRIALADRRGITLQKKVLAKLMLAEYYKPSFIDALMKPESKEELKQLEEYEIPKQNSHLEKTRDVFLFMCYTGLRYSDVANLKRCDIQESHIEIVTEKTNVVLNIDLNTHSRRILQKYERYRFKKDAALPMISNQKMNQNLHELCKQAGFNQPVRIINYQGCQRIDEIKPKYEVIGTHTGRRSFICNAISMGIPPQVVMKWTGHSDYKAMKPYIDVCDEIKAEAMKKFDDP